MRLVLLIISSILILVSMWIALTKGLISGPPANPDSVVRNIIYFHVPGSICALISFVVLAAASIGFLITGKNVWDNIALASAEVGTVFATILNLTGCIFSRAEWGPWWTPTPRLVTAALLWFLYVVYLILRSSVAGSAIRRARVCAVYAIIAFLDVPLVFISARYLPDMHRASFSFGSPWQRTAFFMSLVATALLGAVLIWMRSDHLQLKTKFEHQLQ